MPIIDVLPKFHGIPVKVNEYACELTTFLRWKKNHKKSRINKKWHKRYGAVYKTCPGVVYLLDPVYMPEEDEFDKILKRQFQKQIICCPHGYEHLKRQIAEEGNHTTLRKGEWIGTPP